ncbi:MAG TPA: hypothetical protein VK588_11340 [Chitinophagaceae bacterium]|nr:hypothetical protein [Chitinophagaceae bacterium]
MNTYAIDTNLATSIAPSEGKAYHKTEAISQHGFYIHNTAGVTHTYHWEIKTCLIHDGIPNVCAENYSGLLTLTPDQVFEFHKVITSHFLCGEQTTTQTYALSSLLDDTGKTWKSEAKSQLDCWY